ncbi:MAG: LemA family protein [Gemmatimonadota bacterium]
MALLVIVVVAAVAIFGLGIGMYNRLVALRERFRNAFAQIDVQLKRRYDLIPNLVETAKGYMRHERETLEAVIQARNQAVSAERAAAANPGSPSAMEGLVGAEQQLGGLLTRFFALAEGYPDLKASTNMQGLQEELASTENRIAFARQAYNDAVMRYNQTRAAVPTNLVATAFRFEQADFFELEVAGERETPRVSFG